MKYSIKLTPYSKNSVLYTHKLFYDKIVSFNKDSNTFILQNKKDLKQVEITLNEYELRNLVNKKTKKVQETIIGRALFGVTMDELDQLIN